MYLPPSLTFLEKKFKNISANNLTHYWLMHDVYFDADYYFNTNLDLHDAFDKSDLEGLKNHYIYSGWREGRFPFKVAVDQFFYIETYPDVQNYPGAPEEHFLAHGYKEGRLPYIHKLELDNYNLQLSFLDPGSELMKNKKQMYQHYASIGYHLLIK